MVSEKKTKKKVENIPTFLELGEYNLLDLKNQSEQPLFGDDWNNIVQIKLNNMKNKLEEESEIHIIARDYYMKIYNRLAIPIISSASLTTFIAGIEAIFSDDSRTANTTKIFSLLIFISSSITAILTGVDKHFKFRERAYNHNTAADDLESLSRYIEQYLYLPPLKRPDCQVVYENARNKSDAIAQRAEFIDMKFKNQYYFNKKNHNIYNKDSYKKEFNDNVVDLNMFFKNRNKISNLEIKNPNSHEIYYHNHSSNIPSDILKRIPSSVDEIQKRRNNISDNQTKNSKEMKEIVISDSNSISDGNDENIEND